jgi:hypothetical protein
MDLDWASWVKLIIGAGIGSALVQSLLPIWREHHQRKKHAAYMAMRLAVILENFAWACANLIQDNRNADHYLTRNTPRGMSLFLNSEPILMKARVGVQSIVSWPPMLRSTESDI